MGVTLLLALLAGEVLGAAVKPGDLTFAAVSDPVQSLMSVTVPLLGILVVRDRERLLSTLWAVVLLAAGLGAFGAVWCAAVTTRGSAPDPWRHAATIALGSVLVQVLAVLVGTGLGRLVRPVPLAFLATFVPLLLWLALSAAPGSAEDWLTPYPTARHLLSGDMSRPAWPQWLTVFLIWGVALNVLGAKRPWQT
ncbi:hypothetical protein GCM10027610_050770 [Dactylosporangium cerinum]